MTPTARADGRANFALRPIRITPNFTAVPAGSVLIEMGMTTVLCTASIDEGVPRWLERERPGHGWVTAEFAMLPGATQPRATREAALGRIGGRTMEIQRLIGRSLRAVTDLGALGPRTIVADCDVLQADGGTRTAAITGAFVALALALDKVCAAGALTGVPLRDTVCAVSCGRVGGEVLLDLCRTEDVAAEVDMNIVMTGTGAFVELQGTGEEAVFTRDEIDGFLAAAAGAVSDLTRLQVRALPAGGPVAAAFSRYL
ncbi:MAG: ribonuclease PH [Candidatus Schekmanbacteria bacterium]|nr:ribonuclease PH [Candidatus Schekmanbacteria bacterium]